MKRRIFDIETDGLLDKVTKVHCLCIKDADTGERWRFNNQPGCRPIEEGLIILSDSDEIIGHNIVGFDLEALRLVYGWVPRPDQKITDTVLLSRMVYSNVGDLDYKFRVKLPGDLFKKRHSLKAWGIRLKVLKGNFGETTDWADWSQEMENYCAQDVEVTDALFKKIRAKNVDPRAEEIEHRFAQLIEMQHRHGFRVDEDALNKLVSELQAGRATMLGELQLLFPPEILTMRTPAYYVDAAGNRYERKKDCRDKALAKTLKEGPMKTKEIPFNPNSGDQVAFRLIEKYGWEPQEFTDSTKDNEDLATRKPKVTGDILRDLPYAEAPLLADYDDVSKLLGMACDGEQGWLRLIKNGRIHGSVNTGGAVTGRCTHSRPNMAQVPKVKVGKKEGKKVVLRGKEGSWGWECRSIFIAEAYQVLVGWDASGLELRCLAHYMALHDGGAFAKVLLEGDIHTANQTAAGFFLRDSAKTFIYAYLYGAGDAKLGSVAIADALAAGQPKPKGTPKKIGKALRARFEKNWPALGKLQAGVKARVSQTNTLRGIDGRILHVRSEHSALNTLLQSCGAILMKRALIEMYSMLTAAGLVWGRDFAFVNNVHDEVQTTCLPEHAEFVGKCGPAALKKAGEYFAFRCPLDGEFKIGNSWAETH